MIVPQDVASLALAEDRREIVPRFGKNRPKAVEIPVDLLRPSEKNAAQHQTETALRMRFGEGKRQSAAPGAAEEKEPFDAEKVGESGDVADQVSGRVAIQRAAGRRPAGAALIEDHDPIGVRIEKPAMSGGRSRARSAMKKQNRRAVRAARLLPVHFVRPIEFQHPGRVRLDRRIQMFAPRIHGDPADRRRAAQALARAGADFRLPRRRRGGRTGSRRTVFGPGRAVVARQLRAAFRKRVDERPDNAGARRTGGWRRTPAPCILADERPAATTDGGDDGAFDE